LLWWLGGLFGGHGPSPSIEGELNASKIRRKPDQAQTISECEPQCQEPQPQGGVGF
jgi:hypothetical protein